MIVSAQEADVFLSHDPMDEKYWSVSLHSKCLPLCIHLIYFTLPSFVYSIVPHIRNAKLRSTNPDFQNNNLRITDPILKETDTYLKKLVSYLKTTS